MMGHISAEAWDMYWVSKASNKAADKHGTSPNEFKALRKMVSINAEQEAADRAKEERLKQSGKGREGKEKQGQKKKKQQAPQICFTSSQFDAFRTMLNVVIDTGMIFSMWAPEVLATLPKVPGSVHVDDIRPIGLVVILRNAFTGTQMRIARVVWYKYDMHAREQFGGVMRVSTDGARLVQNCAFEEGAAYAKDVATGNEDKEKAFDLPTVTMGYQGGMYCFGIPEEYIIIDEKMQKLADLYVRHAYGYAQPLKKGGVTGVP